MSRVTDHYGFYTTTPLGYMSKIEQASRKPPILYSTMVCHMSPPIGQHTNHSSDESVVHWIPTLYYIHMTLTRKEAVWRDNDRCT